MSLVIAPPVENIWRIPAHRFHQGRRTAYSFVMSLGEIDGFLPERVDDRVIREANRRLTPAHARDIEAYLNSNPHSWVLGTLMLGIAPDAVGFTPFADAAGIDHPVAGELAIRLDRKGSLRIFDGQHRRLALHQALAKQDHQKNADLLRTASLPVVLYEEDDIGALRQMFADAAKAKSIERNTVTQFDLQDPFNVAALRLTEQSSLFGTGCVEKEKSTVSPTEPRLLAINQLATILKTLRVGYGGRVSRERMADAALEQDVLNATCLAWSDEFLVAAREEYDWLANGVLTNTNIPHLRRETFAVTVPIMRVMAGCYFQWRKEVGDDWQPLAMWLRQANLQANPEDAPNSIPAQAGMLVNGSLSSRDQGLRKTISLIMEGAAKASRDSEAT